MLTSPLPFTSGPTVERKAQRLFVKHFLANVLLLRYHLAKAGLGKVKAHRAFVADHTFITTRAPYKNKTTRNQYLIRRFGYRITAELTPTLVDHDTLANANEALDRLAELRRMVGELDFVHASVAFSSVSLRISFLDLSVGSCSKNGRLALSVS